MDENAALHIIVPGVCPPAPRPRFGIMPTRKLAEIVAMVRRGCGMRELMGCFRPAPFPPADDAYRAWKRAAAVEMNRARMEHCGRLPFAPAGTPLEVHLLFVMPLPKAAHRQTKPPPRSWCVSKRRGDADNLAKGPLDAANGVLWHDDAAVASIEVETVVAAQGEAPRTEIIVMRLAESDAVRTRFEQVRAVLRSAGRLLDPILDRSEGTELCRETKEQIRLEF
jgi:Holliday junction resolvase RusA-like endonuclease